MYDSKMLPIRIGFGYDVHAFCDGRPLVLGGVNIRHSRGLLGHSDADVVIHAIMDALLGAAALGDIGKHFPNNDPAYKDIASTKLLDKVRHHLASLGYHIGNIDATIVAEEPKLSNYIDSMRKVIAASLAISADFISIKATTTEGLGPMGRKEGIAAYATAAIYHQQK